MLRRSAFLLLALCLCAAASEHVTEVFDEPTDRPAALVKAGILPDPVLSPGAIFSDITLEQIRQPNFDATIRNVPESLKKKVFRSYGLDPDKIRTGDYEIDHICECALGGAQDAANLWPEKYAGPLGAHTKDHLERVLLKLVRDGKVPLRQAQHEISGDWTQAYIKYVGPLPTE
ncbi:MAG TPA: hypothetical protein VK797_23310 [Tepidisphaeraceae bacterium]|jgi:hypothetical protein|nr:hypothetical protein [Tepidisphaeraceae bacterium]